jgi:hypothetical protein
MSKSKVFNSQIIKMLQRFKGQFMIEQDIKNKFSSQAGGIDCLLRVEKTIFLFIFKWDNGVMSVNNITQFFKSCNVVIDNIKKQHPEKVYTFYKIAVTKKPVNFPDNADQAGNPKLFNVHLDPAQLSCGTGQENMLENAFMEYAITQLYNAIAKSINQDPGMVEKVDQTLGMVDQVYQNQNFGMGESQKMAEDSDMMDVC